MKSTKTHICFVGNTVWLCLAQLESLQWYITTNDNKKCVDFKWLKQRDWGLKLQYLWQPVFCHIVFVSVCGFAFHFISDHC